MFMRSRDLEVKRSIEVKRSRDIEVKGSTVLEFRRSRDLARILEFMRSRGLEVEIQRSRDPRPKNFSV